jgi:hypothetical protein
MRSHWATWVHQLSDQLASPGTSPVQVKTLHGFQLRRTPAIWYSIVCLGYLGTTNGEMVATDPEMAPGSFWSHVIKDAP